MSTEAEVMKLRKENRTLRIDNKRLSLAHKAQKKKRDILEELLRERDEHIRLLEIQREEIGKLIEELKRQRNMYRDMTFKKNKNLKLQESKDQASSSNINLKNKKHVGGQMGHIGHGRTSPDKDKIDATQRVYLTNCPACHSTLKRSSTCFTRIIEDIMELLKSNLKTTKYEIERQWCSHCKGEVTGNPIGVIPHSKLGINLMVMTLIQKYALHTPLNKISFLFKTAYGINITTGGITNLLNRTKKYFGSEYDNILNEIRKAKVKHADETGWRIDGINNWIWGFMTKKEVYLTAEDSRGKGVPIDILQNQSKENILVRDDYAVYKNLKLTHQSCWAHLMRKSHERNIEPDVSQEMKDVHTLLSNIFADLRDTVSFPFEINKREEIYQDIWKNIKQNIIDKKFQYADVKTIQTRIKNQGKNLLTAVLHDDVPLTNNLAERALRPMVVMRKISGGSKSMTGAKTHAVNMSIFQTIQLRNQPLISTLQNLLLKGSSGEN
mgnify:FL=1